MKGVSAVIATILMLIITIALAGMAYMYISGFFYTSTAGVELADAYCSAGTVNIKIKNIGSTDIGADSITIDRSSPAPLTDPCAAADGTDAATCAAVDACGGTGNCVWDGVASECNPPAVVPDGYADDCGTSDSCCASTISPGSALWYKDATCGSAKSCVYRITPPVGKTVIATQYCT